jgi:LEA14-like dessication related protein
LVYYFSLYPPSGIIFNSIHNYLEIICPIDVLRFPEFKTMINHLSETLMLNDIQISSDYMSRWVVLKRRVGAVKSRRVLDVLFNVNILQCFFVVENLTANAVSVAIGNNGNRLIFEI